MELEVVVMEQIVYIHHVRLTAQLQHIQIPIAPQLFVQEVTVHLQLFKAVNFIINNFQPVIDYLTNMW